ncbi:MAG: BatD family protein [Candidatus Omnitrophota bacterium]
MVRKNLLIIFIIFLSVCPFSLAEAENEGDIEITAESDKKEVYIGDRIRLDITARNVSGTEVIFPDTPKTLAEFSVIGSYPMKEKRSGQGIKGQVYVLSIYTTGTHVIPPVEVRYRFHDQDEWQAKLSPQVPVEVLSVLTGKDTDIKDLKGLVAFGGFNPWLVFILAAALVGLLLWRLWRKRKATAALEEAGPKPAHVVAYKELEELRAMDLPEKGRIKEYYFCLSDIVRRYLESRFSYRAPEMTTEEFLGAIKDSREFSSELRELLKEFLSHCDLVKFAKYGPTPLEILDSFKAAENLVDQTKLVEEEGGEDG